MKHKFLHPHLDLDIFPSYTSSVKIKYRVSPDSRVHKLNSIIKDKYPDFLDESNPDMILTAGGDGGMHHTIFENSDFDGIFFGIAMGNLNFLMNVVDDEVKLIDNLISNKIKIHIVETSTFDVYKNDAFIGKAVNDVIFGSSINGYHEYTLSTQDGSFDEFTFKGTGLCIATALGSTAYNYNNGGPILPLESEICSITGIVTNRYLKDILQMQHICIKANGGNIYLSGIDKGSINNSDAITLKPSKRIKIGFLNKEEFNKKRVDFAHRYRKSG